MAIATAIGMAISGLLSPAAKVAGGCAMLTHFPSLRKKALEHL